MNQSQIYRVLKNYILVVALLLPSLVFSLGRQGWKIRPEGFAVKTDLLSVINSTVEDGLKSYSISGEIYFNNEYSLNVDLGGETESESESNRVEKRFGGHIRWYFKQDDCNCSAFFAGSYFSIVNMRQTIDHKFPTSYSVSYSRSSIEGGFCGGYQALLANHFVIDPTVQMGIEFQHGIHNTESTSNLSDTHDTGLLLRVSLGIGYRF